MAVIISTDQTGANTPTNGGSTSYFIKSGNFQINDQNSGALILDNLLSGGIVLGSSATFRFRPTVASSGGIAIGSSGTITFRSIITTSGGIQIGGSGLDSSFFPIFVVASGGSTIGGTLGFFMSSINNPSGGVSIGTTSLIQANYNRRSTGGIVLGGTSTDDACFAFLYRFIYGDYGFVNPSLDRVTSPGIQWLRSFCRRISRKIICCRT